MADSKESFHESLIIKRAKRRLIGAITILIILFTLSLFFIKNKGEIQSNDKTKITFLEMGPASFSLKKNLDRVTPERNPDELKKDTNLNLKSEKEENKSFTVQIGIFSDETKILQISNQIKKIGFETKVNKIKLSGKEKIKLTTQFFATEKEAQAALIKLKNANFPGLIKRK